METGIGGGVEVEEGIVEEGLWKSAFGLGEAVAEAFADAAAEVEVEAGADAFGIPCWVAGDIVGEASVPIPFSPPAHVLPGGDTPCTGDIGTTGVVGNEV